MTAPPPPAPPPPTKPFDRVAARAALDALAPTLRDLGVSGNPLEVTEELRGRFVHARIR